MILNILNRCKLCIVSAYLYKKLDFQLYHFKTSQHMVYIPNYAQIWKYMKYCCKRSYLHTLYLISSCFRGYLAVNCSRYAFYLSLQDLYILSLYACNIQFLKVKYFILSCNNLRQYNHPLYPKFFKVISETVRFKTEMEFQDQSI